MNFYDYNILATTEQQHHGLIPYYPGPYPYFPLPSYPTQPLATTSFPVVPAQCLWETNGQACQATFQDSKEFEVHLLSVHIKHIHSFKCEWNECGAKFKARYRLVEHTRIHTRHRPFVCKECGKIFARSENLKTHNRVHTGEKPYPCPHPGCPRMFSSTSDRKKHDNTHTNERLYSCKYCPSIYNHPCSLRKHESKKHQNELTPTRTAESVDSGFSNSPTLTPPTLSPPSSTPPTNYWNTSPKLEHFYQNQAPGSNFWQNSDDSVGLNGQFMQIYQNQNSIFPVIPIWNNVENPEYHQL